MGGAESGEVARDGDEVDAAVALVELQYDGAVLGSVAAAEMAAKAAAEAAAEMAAKAAAEAAAVRQRQRQRCVGRAIYGARLSQTVLN